MAESYAEWRKRVFDNMTPAEQRQHNRLVLDYIIDQHIAVVKSLEPGEMAQVYHVMKLDGTIDDIPADVRYRVDHLFLEPGHKASAETKRIFCFLVESLR